MFIKNTFKVIQTFPQKLWNLEEVKNYLRISHNYDDELISNLTYAAVIATENFLNQNIIIRRIEFRCNIKNAQHFILQYKPVIEISKVILKDSDTEVQLKEGEYYSDNKAHILYLAKPLQHFQEISVEYLAGTPENIMEYAIKYGILLHIAQLYDREQVSEGQFSKEIMNLFLPYRQLQI